MLMYIIIRKLLIKPTSRLVNIWQFREGKELLSIAYQSIFYHKPLSTGHKIPSIYQHWVEVGVISH